MSSTADLKILKAITKFRKADTKAAKHLQKMANEAEESGDYDDYDQACYDYWEAGNEAGLDLATEIEGILFAAVQDSWRYLQGTQPPADVSSPDESNRRLDE